MVHPDDPDFTAKRLEKLLDEAINQVARESVLPMITLHRILLKKLHRCMKEVIELKLAEFLEESSNDDLN